MKALWQALKNPDLAPAIVRQPVKRRHGGQANVNLWGVRSWHETLGKTPVEAKFSPEVSAIELRPGREISSADGRAHYRVAEDGSVRRLNKPRSKKAKRRAIRASNSRCLGS